MIKCITCKADLNCVFKIETSDKDFPVRKAYQWWECRSCGEKYFATLEENKWDVFDDRLQHQGYLADKEGWKKSLAIVQTCADPDNDACPCPVHKDLPPNQFHGSSAWYTYD